MSSHKNLGRFRTRSLLGSVLLTLAALLVQQVTLCEGRVPLHAQDALDSNNNKRNDIYASVAMAAAEAKRHEALWKRRQGHSPFTNNDSPPKGSLTQTGGGRRKRSLFSHVNDDLPPPEPERLVKELHVSRERQEQLGNQYNSDQERQQQQQQQQHRQNAESRDPFKAAFHEQEPEDADFWGENESRTLIEPHYPSIDLFEEEDDDDHHNNINDNEGHDNNHHQTPSTVEDDEDEELIELGEDGVFRRLSVEHDRTNGRLYQQQQQQQQQQQVWMVDEWEEDLEGEMDELLDWAEDEEQLLLERIERLQGSSNDMGSEDEQLRDHESSLRNFVLEDEDEASPFERIFSESWLF